jgi:hypothetical protein
MICQDNQSKLKQDYLWYSSMQSVASFSVLLLDKLASLLTSIPDDLVFGCNANEFLLAGGGAGTQPHDGMTACLHSLMNYFQWGVLEGWNACDYTVVLALHPPN